MHIHYNASVEVEDPEVNWLFSFKGLELMMFKGLELNVVNVC